MFWNVSWQKSTPAGPFFLLHLRLLLEPREGSFESFWNLKHSSFDLSCTAIPFNGLPFFLKPKYQFPLSADLKSV